jgi:hypothetical protein
MLTRPSPTSLRTMATNPALVATLGRPARNPQADSQPKLTLLSHKQSEIPQPRVAAIVLGPDCGVSASSLPTVAGSREAWAGDATEEAGAHHNRS